MIPRVVHYVWVGRSPLGELQRRCIASWHTHLPDYELKLWNEDTLPAEIMSQPYVQKTYREQRWAFVSDYIRFFMLEKEGGIYLDTDTEVLRSFDPLLSHAAFFGRTKDGYVGAGVIGAVSHHPAISRILAEYDNNPTLSVADTSPRIVTRILKEISSDVTVYDYRYFNPCDDGERCTPDKLAAAYTNNHWAESWVPFARFRKLLRRTGLMRLLKAVYAAKN